MTLQELTDTLFKRGLIVPSRHKSIGTTIRVLANAVGYDTPETCPHSAFYVSNWKRKLTEHVASEKYLAVYKPATPKVLTNHRNNVSFIFRQAAKAELFESFVDEPVFTMRPRRVSRAEQTAQSPYKTHFTRKEPYRLQRKDWPIRLRDEWERIKKEKIYTWREPTIHLNEKNLACFVGFLVNVRGERLHTFNDVLVVDRISDYIIWHAERMETRITSQGKSVLKSLLVVAKHLEHPEADNIAAYAKSLPEPSPVHDDRHHDVSLVTIDQAADQMLRETRQPLTSYKCANRGAQRASKFQWGLIIKFLCRHPLRQRNIREMQLDKNLFWHKGELCIKFVGEELKVATRKGRANVYEINLHQESPELVSLFEEFLTVHRPTLPHATTHRNVFLSQRGNVLTPGTMSNEISERIYQYTGERVSPHRFRDLYATTVINEAGDFEAAADALGDNLQTVLSRYYYARQKPIKERQATFRRSFFNRGSED